VIAKHKLKSLLQYGASGESRVRVAPVLDPVEIEPLGNISDIQTIGVDAGTAAAIEDQKAWGRLIPDIGVDYENDILY